MELHVFNNEYPKQDWSAQLESEIKFLWCSNGIWLCGRFKWLFASRMHTLLLFIHVQTTIPCTIHGCICARVCLWMWIEIAPTTVYKGICFFFWHACAFWEFSSITSLARSLSPLFLFMIVVFVLFVSENACSILCFHTITYRNRSEMIVLFGWTCAVIVFRIFRSIHWNYGFYFISSFNALNYAMKILF